MNEKRRKRKQKGEKTRGGENWKRRESERGNKPQKREKEEKDKDETRKP